MFKTIKNQNYKVLTIFLCVFGLSACSEGHPDDLPGAVNNPYPDVSISPSSQVTIDPADTSMNYSVPVTFSRPAPENGVISFRVTEGTARQGRDYEVVATEVSFNEGERQVNIPIELINDEERLQPRSFRVELTGARHAYLTDSVSHEVTIAAREEIEDDVAEEPPTLILPNSVSWVAPQPGATVQNNSLVIPLSDNVASDASVEIRLVSGTAKSGQHFGDVTGTNCEENICTVAAGRGELDFFVPIYSDLDHDEKSFKIQFLNASGMSLPQEREVEVTLTYLESPQLAQLNVPQGLNLRMPSEQRSPLAYPIVFTLSQALQEPANIEIRSVDGTAIAGKHFVNLNATGDSSISLDAGVNELFFELELIHDADLEENVTFELQLLSAEGLVLGDTRSVEVEIINTNPSAKNIPTITLPSEVVYHEPISTQDYEVILPLSELMPQAGSVRAQLIEQDARAGIDFEAYSEVIDIPQYSSEIKLPLTLLYNPAETDDLTFRIELSDAVNVNLGSERSFEVRIVDAGSAAPEPRLQLTPDLVRVPTPGFGIGVQRVSLYFELSEPLSEEGSVFVRTRNGTAADGVDYDSIGRTIVVRPDRNEIEVNINIYASSSSEQREFELIFSVPDGIRLPENRSVTVQIDPLTTNQIPRVDTPESVVLMAPEAIVGSENGLRRIVLPLDDLTPLRGRLRVSTQNRTARDGNEFSLTDPVIEYGIGEREVVIPIWLVPITEVKDFEIIIENSSNIILPEAFEDRVIRVFIEPYS